jgi:nucleoside-diphosphate-sugar epimerase
MTISAPIIGSLSRGHSCWAIFSRQGTIVARSCELSDRGSDDFAAASLVGESTVDPQKCCINNVVGTFSLLNVMRGAGCRRTVFSSPGAVYSLADSKALAVWRSLQYLTMIMRRRTEPQFAISQQHMLRRLNL